MTAKEITQKPQKDCNKKPDPKGNTQIILKIWQRNAQIKNSFKKAYQIILKCAVENLMNDYFTNLAPSGRPT